MGFIKNININYFGYIREYYTYFLYQVNNHTPKSKFVIFGRGRSGSTLLVSLLNSSNEIYCDREILSRPVMSLEKFIDTRSKIFNKDAYGFKLLSSQIKPTVLNKINAPVFFKYLIEEDFKIIYLLRKNYVRQSISKLYGYYRSRWHEKSDGNSIREVGKMKVDLVELLNNIEDSKKTEEYELKLMRNIPHLEVIYETDLLHQENHQVVVDRIARFLSIPTFNAKTDLKRITTSNFDGFIENSKEMIDFLILKGYREFL